MKQWILFSYLYVHFSSSACSLFQGKPFPFQDVDLGFDTGDYVLNQAAKILHLLYIHNLRDLQTRINECVVAVQSVTANPKTDTKLGKVGK
jgi:RLL motif-containing protein 1